MNKIKPSEKDWEMLGMLLRGSDGAPEILEQNSLPPNTHIEVSVIFQNSAGHCIAMINEIGKAVYNFFRVGQNIELVVGMMYQTLVGPGTHIELLKVRE